MPRILRPWLIATSLVLGSASLAAPRIERGNLVFDNVPDAPAAVVESLDGYLGGREASPLGWSPQGQLLITTRFGDVDQLHLVEKPEGVRRQIGFLHEPVTDAAFSPDPGRAAYFYLKDSGGGGNVQLYYQRLDQPAAKLLTDGKSRNGAPVWSNSGREIAFFTNARDGASYDIDIVDPESDTLPHLGVAGDDAAAWYPLDWSPDDRKLLVLKYVSAGEAYLYVVDLATGQKREVDPAPGRVGIGGARFSRDGQGVYLISDRDGEFRRLRYVSFFNSDKSVLSDHIPWDIEELAISRDGRHLAFVSNENGSSRLNLVDLRAHQDMTAPPLPAPGLIDHLSFDSDGKQLAFGYTSANAPRDAYVLDLAANRLQPWTRSEPGAVDAAGFVTPRLAQFPTFDRVDGRPRQIPVYLYEPRSAGPHPVLLMLHGGPEAQFRPEFDPWIQYAVNELGYAVVAPNIRGSSGYGKSYLALDDGLLRDDAVKDVGALIVWVDSQASLDPKHVVVAGSAYGGYLALAALMNYGDRLRGGVDIAGISDFIGYLSSTAPYRRNLRRQEYGDERNTEMRAYLRRISPLTNAERITRPLLVVHGRNDPRVPSSQSDELVNRLRSRGGEVWYLQALDEGHGFGKLQNRLACYEAFAQFMKSLP
jgi:dipeptidyl aminopeptidase/acylaminoacyl peptidase